MMALTVVQTASIRVKKTKRKQMELILKKLGLEDLSKSGQNTMKQRLLVKEIEKELVHAHTGVV